MNRKGYLHSIEGVIAGLLVVFYVGAMVEAPTPTDWDKTSLTKRSGDLMGAFSRTGLLDTAVTEDKPRMLTAVMGSMGADMEYRMRLQGVPQPSLNVGMLLRGQDIQRSGSGAATCPTGVTSAEFGCRDGTILGVPFALADRDDNSLVKYSAVHFDFDEDDDYGEDSPAEGPFLFGDFVDWCPSGDPDDCEGTFQIGYINDTLTLYNVTRFEKLLDHETINANGFNIEAFYTAQTVRDTITASPPGPETVDFEGTELEIRWTTNGVEFREDANWEEYFEGESAGLFGEFYEIESVDPLRAVPENDINEDALVAKDIAPSYLEEVNASLKEFLSQDSTLIELTNIELLDDEAFDDGFHGQLGLRRPDVDIVETGTTSNMFTDTTTPGGPEEFIENYFYDHGIVVEQVRFEDASFYSTATFSLRGESVCANVSTTTDDLSIREISEGGCTGWDMSTGSRVALADNLYRVVETMPLRLSPEEDYRFDDFHRGKVRGSNTVLKLPGWRWNVSEASFNVSLADSGAGSLTGLPDSGCSSGNRYKRGVLDGTYPVVATNIAPCDDGNYEYINFDFNGNDAVDDDETDTPDGFSDEGIHLNGEQIRMNGSEYVLQMGEAGNWLYIQRNLQEEVATAVWERNVYQGDGRYFYMGNASLGADGRALLQSVLLRAGTRQYQFTPSRLIGEPNVGTTYTETIDNNIYTPYSINSVWWFT